MSVKANNLAVWALKHSGSQSKATEDFQKLDQMCRTLCYPLAIFLNIGSCETHLGGYGGGFKDRLHAFAIPGVSGSKIKYAHFIDGGLIEKDIAL